MYKKILIANRGEIAVRVIRACKELGINTVAVYSEVDKDSLHVKMADESVCIGPGPATESYLNIPNIISAAMIKGCDAIHPGYGFFAENVYFAEVCESSGIKFIGPSREVIEKMGDKLQARKIMKKAGVSIIPGTEEPLNINDPNIFKIAKDLGYPLIVKAALGGGGKGMRIVTSEDALKSAVTTAQQEAKSSFANDKVYLEKYIENCRHIEFQIAADLYGKIVYFPERDCSIQRRYQKLVEESPSPFMNKKLRERMGRAAIKAAKVIKYHTVGTIEFIVDDKERFYFLEVNTRIQVEHPVTEIVTGIDLVKEQIKLSAGEKLKYDSEDIKINNHVIECRINAEDPEKDFVPSPGKITNLILPGGFGVRVDTHIYAGYTIPSFYDSLIAKLLGFDTTRDGAIGRLRRALTEFYIEGIKTTTGLHLKILNNKDFIEGKYHTDFVVKNIL